MKRSIIITIITFLICSGILSQEKQTTLISGTYIDIEFIEFAELIQSQYNISFYYKPQWVENIEVNITGDSLNLEIVLNDLLNPAGLHYFDMGNGQIFITGESSIDDSAVRDLIESFDKPETSKNTDNRIAGNISYEKRVKTRTVGNPKKRESSGLSLVTGHITSSLSGEPVTGATIVVEGTSNGEITNAEGFFALNMEAGSSVNLNISCLGMEKETLFVTVNSSGILNIELHDKLIDIQEVIVKSGKHDNVRGIQMGFQRLAIKELKTIPIVMGERDILKVASMMPGVQTVGEGSAGLNVRGSSSDQNLFLLNEIPIYNTGHLLGFFSAFNPDMISDFNLYKSNFPAEYGGRLASVFEISTRKGNKKKFGARGALSPVTASLMVETPIIRDKVSFIAGGRSTYSDWILGKIDDFDIQNSSASFYDLMTGIHILPDEKSSLELFIYLSKDKFNLGGTREYRHQNKGASVVYNRQLDDGWKMEIAGVLSRYNNYQSEENSMTNAFSHEFDVSHSEIKTKITGFKFTNHTISAGGNFILHNLNHGIYTPKYGIYTPNYGIGWPMLQEIDFGKEKGLEYALFVADEYKITDKLMLYGGLRYSSFNYLGPKEILTYSEFKPKNLENITDTLFYEKGQSIVNYNGPEFRLSLNQEINPDLSLKVSFNRMRQYIFMLSNTVAISPSDRWKMADPHITPSIADQISFGVYKNINTRALETSAELYFKNTRGVLEYKDGADFLLNPNFETSILQGNQKSYGAEFFVKRNAGRLTGWISYAYSRSLIKVDGGYTWAQINDGIEYAANYDKPHSFNLIGSYSISRRISIASNLVYDTGRPITYPTGKFFINGMEAVSYSRRNEFRIPDYFRVDLSLSIEGNLVARKFAHGSWMFSVYNITGRRNAYSIYFKNEGGKIQGYKQSIYGVPIFTVSYNFKLGNYAVE